jgi:hypothetical protein
MQDPEGDEDKDMEEDVEDFPYEPTPEEIQSEQAYQEFLQRFPTFNFVYKVVTRRSRFLKLEQLGAPQLVLDEEMKMLNSALDDLRMAMPFEVDPNPTSVFDGEYSLATVILHFRNELLHPPISADKPEFDD